MLDAGSALAKALTALLLEVISLIVATTLPQFFASGPGFQPLSSLSRALPAAIANLFACAFLPFSLAAFEARPNNSELSSNINASFKCCVKLCINLIYII